MVGRASSEIGSDSQELSWSTFIDLLIECGVPNAAQLGPSSSLRGAAGMDHLQRALILAAVRHIDVGLPSELLRSVDTVGEAYEWCKDAERKRGVRTADPAPVTPGASRLIRLRSLRQDDVPALYQGLMEPDRAFRWRYRGAMPGLQQFGQDLLDGSTFVQMVIEVSGSPRPVGLVQAYQANLQSGTCYFAFARADGQRDGLGEMTIGLYGFLDYLFRAFPFRKLYAEVPGFNWPQFCSGERSLFEVEGILRDHDYWNERHWDLRMITIARERWRQIRETWSNTLRGQLEAVLGTDPH